MEKAALISLLEKHEAFESSPPEALEQLIDAAEVTSLEEAAPLIQQGRSGESIWMLIEGELDILVDGEQVNHIAAKGEVVGEISAVSQTAAPATVQSRGHVTALRIPQEALHEVMSASPQLAASMLRSMAKYLGRR